MNPATPPASAAAAGPGPAERPPPAWRLAARLAALTVAEWRHHPWRQAAALLAVALGVALAASVQVINASALAEFSQAVRSVQGEPDASLAATTPEGFDDAAHAVLARDESVRLALPVVSLKAAVRLPAAQSAAPNPGTQAAGGADAAAPSTSPRPGAADRGPPLRVLRVIGTDLLQVQALAPQLAPSMADPPDAASSPRPEAWADRLQPDRIWLNAAARAALSVRDGDRLELGGAGGWQAFTVAGSIGAGGDPLAVVDIAAAQHRLGRGPRLDRIDLRLAPGLDRAAWQAGIARQLREQSGAADLQAAPHAEHRTEHPTGQRDEREAEREAKREAEQRTKPRTARQADAAAPDGLPPGLGWSTPDDAAQRMSSLSRAYRVNLGVLAMVALLVGGFLVYSVVTLSVAQRLPQLALLGVLGLPAAARRWLVVGESALTGLAGSALGLAAGVGLAALALKLLGGDLGGGFFAGTAPALHWPLTALAACGLLGLAASVAGAWIPARQAEALAPAQALKGLGTAADRAAGSWRPWVPGLALLAAGGGLALLPPIGGLPLAAYAAIGVLLVGGVWLIPAFIGLATAGGWTPRGPLALLAWRRARFAREVTQAAVAGVVASLALSVAITVMVASFRLAVSDWLDRVLPADLYLRPAAGLAALDPGFAAAVARLPGVQRSAPGRQRMVQLDPAQPAVMLLARELGPDPSRTLPLVDAGPAPPGSDADPEAGGAPLDAWISEAAATRPGWRIGAEVVLPIAQRDGTPLRLRIRGIWRDYARQSGSIAVELADYQRRTGDRGLNELALWLAPGAALAEVDAALNRLAPATTPIESIGTQALRQISLAIFDRSFAVTVYLQAVAIGVGLVGVAASLSAQVLARRKEFGLLAHLGFTRRQVLGLVVAESAAGLAAGVAVGLVLGLGMAAVLVHVVNPQSFHWTMPLRLPEARLAALAAAVLLTGVLTAAFSARRAAGRDAVQAVKEDW